MKIKLDKDGNVILTEDKTKPIFEDKDGNDIEVDVPKLFDKVAALNGENKSVRKKLQKEIDEATGKLELFVDIEDLTVWKGEADQAIETVKNIDHSKLVDAGKVETLKAEMKNAFEDEKKNIVDGFEKKITELNGALTGKDATIYDLMVSAKFAQSPFFSGDEPKTLVPPEIAETYFGKNFKVETVDGKLRVVGYLNDAQIYSRQDPGELANFDEALGIVVEAYPMKDRIMRAGKAGSGASGGGDGGAGGAEQAGSIADYEKQYAEAEKVGNSKLMIALKNRIFNLKRIAQTKQQTGA